MMEVFLKENIQRGRPFCGGVLDIIPVLGSHTAHILMVEHGKLNENTKRQNQNAYNILMPVISHFSIHLYRLSEFNLVI